MRRRRCLGKAELSKSWGDAGGENDVEMRRQSTVTPRGRRAVGGDDVCGDVKGRGLGSLDSVVGDGKGVSSWASYPILNSLYLNMPRYRRPAKNTNLSAVEKIVIEFDLVVALSEQSLELDGVVLM
ncbi:hypothetical protein M0R45_026249 [Rubus argutus]|uniref:Uncharacterized protein n=1 Tax=Rubus argutus TaxID=59490 RepID=A0AAW1WZJ7_RUBAR